MDKFDFDARIFSSADVASICILTERELERAVDSERSLLQLKFFETNRVGGKPREFCINDVLKIATFYALIRLGFNRKNIGHFCNHVAGRAHATMLGFISRNSNEVSYLYTNRAGEMQISQSYTENILDVDAHCFVTVKTDQIIRHVFAQMQAVIAEREIEKQ
jgi:hypothetical protein